MALDKCELAWAAGFFDGEGHVRSKPESLGRRCELQVAQKTTGCLERLQKAVGDVGTIGGPYHTKNPCYFWYLTKTAVVDEVLTKLWPYLSAPKKEQATKAGFKLGTIRNLKLGRRPIDPALLQVPTCHPERKHVAFGLCGSCYHLARRKNGK